MTTLVLWLVVRLLLAAVACVLTAWLVMATVRRLAVVP